MNAMAKKGRDALKAKARKMAEGDNQKVDASSWTPPAALKADVKTGMRPVSRRAYKSGGKVTGEDEAPRMDRKPRGSCDPKEMAIAKTNRNVKTANEEREGEKHIGGLKSGGRAKKANGGPPGTKPVGVHKGGAEPLRAIGVDKGPVETRRPIGVDKGSVGAPGTKPVGLDKDQVERMERGMKKGGRTERKSGGRVGKTNINIVIATKPQGGQDGTVTAPMAMRPPGGIPVPVPPPGGAGGPPPGMPMPMGPPPGAAPMGPPPGMPPMARKSGGRVFRTYKDMKAGAGSGEGRLEKTEIQKNKG